MINEIIVLHQKAYNKFIELKQDVGNLKHNSRNKNESVLLGGVACYPSTNRKLATNIISNSVDNLLALKHIPELKTLRNTLDEFYLDPIGVQLMLIAHKQNPKIYKKEFGSHYPYFDLLSNYLNASCELFPKDFIKSLRIYLAIVLLQDAKSSHLDISYRIVELIESLEFYDGDDFEERHISLIAYNKKELQTKSYFNDLPLIEFRTNRNYKTNPILEDEIFINLFKLYFNDNSSLK